MIAAFGDRQAEVQLLKSLSFNGCSKVCISPERLQCAVPGRADDAE